MAKWILIIFLLMVTPFTYSAVQVQYSCDGNITWKDVIWIDENNTEALQHGIQQDTDCCFRAKNQSTEWGYACTDTKEGLDMVNGIGITLFLIFINAVLFILPLFIKFSDSEIKNKVIKRGIYVLAFFFLAFTSSVMFALADKSDLGIGTQILTLMQVFAWVGIFGIIILTIMSIREWVVRLREAKRSRLMGDD